MTTQRTVFRRSTAGPPYTLERSTEPLPELGPTQVLLQTHAFSLNYRDANILRGTNPWPVLAHGIPCSDASCTVAAVGTHATSNFKIGERVVPHLDANNITGRESGESQWMGGNADGVLASHLVVDSSVCVRVPANLSHAEAACLPNAALTAWSAISPEGRGALAGQSLLTQGTGGVSIFAARLALAAGWRVFLTTGSSSKIERVRGLKGFDGERLSVIDSASTTDWAGEALRLNAGRGVDVVLDNGGTSSLLQSVRALRKGGVVSQVGYMGRQDVADLEGLISRLIEKNAGVRGINCGTKLDLEDFVRFIEDSGVRFDDLVSDRFVGFEEVERAFETLERGGHIGKVVIEVT